MNNIFYFREFNFEVRCLLTQSVFVKQHASFIQRTLFLMGPGPDLGLTRPDQVIKEHILIVDFQFERGILFGVIEGELFFPPGVGVVITHRGFTHKEEATEHFDVAVCDPQDVLWEARSPQVEYLDLGVVLGYGQTTQDEYEQRDSGGHGSAVQKKQLDISKNNTFVNLGPRDI